MKSYGLILVFVCFSLITEAQSFKEGESFKLGISGGYNLTTVRGTELIDPKLKTGFSIGMYYRHRLSPRFYSLVEGRTTFKGSRFEARLDDDYERLDLVYIDLPLQLMFDIKKDDKHLVFIGPQVSALVNSRMFIHQNISGPGSYATYLSKDIDLRYVDYSAVAGYQYNGYYMGIHAALKASVLNINNGLNLEGVNQPTGTNGTIYNLALELIVMF